MNDKFKGGNALMNLEQKPRKVRGFGEVPESETVTQPPNPVTQPSNLATQLPEPVTQLPAPVSVKESESLATQLPNRPVTQLDERLFPSRIERRQKSIRLPASKLPKYEEYQFQNRHIFKDFQDMVEYALDWVTSHPATQLPNLPNTQLPALTNKELNNQLSFNGEKGAKDMAVYSTLTGNPAKPKDWEAYAEIAHLDSAVIEQGIRSSILKAQQTGRGVFGFRWCIFSILNAAQSPSTKPAPSPVDASQCPDCRGEGYYYPDGPGKGVKLCLHPKLREGNP